DGRTPLGDETLRAVAPGTTQGLLTASLQLLGDPHRCRRPAQDFRKNGPPLLVALLPQVFAVMPEDVEDEERFLRALLEKLEPRRPSFVESDDLAVEHDVFLAKLVQRLRDPRKTPGEVDL